LRGARVLGEPVDNELDPPLDGFVEPQECLSRIVTPFDLVGH